MSWIDNPDTECKKILVAKGWTSKRLQETLGLSERQISRIVNKDNVRDIYMVKGLENLNTI